ncbi:energy transducer TonB [Hymenobacter busanensis]|uniref:Energy transducer TonB n=1 Tax=Hymenobacter busanensis TaxID=2607656 RepID=A0A7L4ZU01_9BACT|nr:energy transducer TonB [Hymenobacter busanensis]KAA9325855.1 energy transducer TonB [Hymenobacter busanensis]QHJ06305.1 TonB family protein [Hymenobacter busanensis]
MKLVLCFVVGACALTVAATAQRPLPSGPERTFSLDYCYQEAAQGQAELGFVCRRYRLSAGGQIDSIYSLEGKQLRRVVRTTWRPTGDTLIAETHWRPDGSRVRYQEALGRKLHGPERLYNADGKLMRQTVYAFGAPKDSSCYDAQGQPIACVGPGYSEQMPRYTGEFSDMMRFLGKNIRYPTLAMRRRAQGKVVVGFIVDETGQLRDVRVKQGVAPDLDAEAVRVIRLMPRWQPAVQQGEPVPVRFAVPVTFTLR